MTPALLRHPFHQLPLRHPGPGLTDSTADGLGASGARGGGRARTEAPDVEVVSRFWSYVDQTGGPDACWPWTRSRRPTGYGYFRAGDRLVITSRFALELSLGRPLAEGMQTCHSCDNPPCCNPAHLFEGTNTDNFLDSLAKGRVAHPNTLDAEKAAEIRELYATGEWSHRTLGHRFGVDPVQIGRITRGESWVASGSPHLVAVGSVPPAELAATPSSDPGRTPVRSHALAAAASGSRGDRHRAGHHESSARTAGTGHAAWPR